MHVLRQEIKNHDQGKYKFEKKMKTGVRILEYNLNMETYLSPTQLPQLSREFDSVLPSSQGENMHVII